jgi:hypothetical protein
LHNPIDAAAVGTERHRRLGTRRPRYDAPTADLVDTALVHQPPGRAGLEGADEGVTAGPLRGLDDDDSEAVIVVVECQLNRDTVLLGVHSRVRDVHSGMGVGALAEAPTVLIEPYHLFAGPLGCLLEIAEVHPVDRQVRTGVKRLGERAVDREPEVLEGSGGNPAPAREPAGPNHAAGVEVVSFVPTVVRHFVAAVGVDHGEEHLTDLDGIVLHASSRYVAVRWQRASPRGPVDTTRLPPRDKTIILAVDAPAVVGQHDAP